MTTVAKAFYDPAKTYDDNFDHGPFPVSTQDEPYQDHGQPRYSFLGKRLYSPFGIPAGPILNSNYVKYAFERGFDAVVYKTQRSVKFQANQFPNVLYVDVDGDLTPDKAAGQLVGSTDTDKPETEFSITNSFGNPSRGPEFWVKDIQKAHGYQGKGQLLIASAVGTIKDGYSDEDYFDDFANAAGLAAGTGVEAIEINLSCPNVANEGILCYTHDSVVAICQKVRAKIGQLPLIVKFGYFSHQQQELLARTVKDIVPYVQAISAINTIPAAVVDLDGQQALPGPNRLVSGICGHSIKWAGLEMVQRLDDLRQKNGYKFEIVGVGGVMTADDFFEYRKAGADLVQSATGAMWHPRLAAEIKERLEED